MTPLSGLILNFCPKRGRQTYLTSKLGMPFLLRPFFFFFLLLAVISLKWANSFDPSDHGSKLTELNLFPRWALPYFLGVTPACENLLAHTAVHVKRFYRLRSKLCLWTSAPLAKLIFDFSSFSSIIPLFSHSFGSEQSGKSKWTSNGSL